MSYTGTGIVDDEHSLIMLFKRFTYPLHIAFLLLFLLFPFRIAQADPSNVVILQSSSIGPYQEAATAFIEALQKHTSLEGPKAVHAFAISRYILSNARDITETLNSIKEKQPKILLAVGSSALAFTNTIPAFPVIYMMVPDPGSIIGNRKNITGVGMELRPATQISGLLAALPNIKRLGVIYDPAKTGGLVNKAKRFADKKGLVLVARKAKVPKEVPVLLNTLRGKVDAFWMLPDPTVVTQETLNLLFLFSLEQRVPILTFSDKFLKKGATVAVTLNLRAIGEIAAGMAARVLNGADIQEIPPVAARKADININKEIARKLGTPVNRDFPAVIE